MPYLLFLPALSIAASAAPKSTLKPEPEGVRGRVRVRVTVRVRDRDRDRARGIVRVRR